MKDTGTLESKQFYDSTDLLEEAQRYKTSDRFLEILYENFKNSKRLLSVGVGPRLLTISSGLTEEFYGLDSNKGSIERSKQFIISWPLYTDDEPFKTEFDFLKQKGIHPYFNEWKFYVGKIPKGFPERFAGTLDSMLASELFLHLTNQEVEDILVMAKKNLRKGGRFVFTTYPSGNPDSLDEKFAELALKVGIERTELIKGGVINIQRLARKLKRRENYERRSKYERNREKFWLDLDKVRVFPTEQIENWIEKSGLNITSKEDVRCGMFPFAYRLVYSLEN